MGSGSPLLKWGLFLCHLNSLEIFIFVAMQYRSRSFFSSPLFSLTMQNNVTIALFGAAPMRQSSTTLVILDLKLYTTISGQCAIDSINVAIPWLCPTPIAMFVNNMFPNWPCLPFVPCSDLLSGFSVYSIFYF